MAAFSIATFLEGAIWFVRKGILCECLGLSNWSQVLDENTVTMQAEVQAHATPSAVHRLDLFNAEIHVRA